MLSIDASFAVHPDMRSHTGAVVKFEDATGMTQSSLAKTTVKHRQFCNSGVSGGASMLDASVMDTIVSRCART